MRSSANSATSARGDGLQGKPDHSAHYKPDLNSELTGGMDTKPFNDLSPDEKDACLADMLQVPDVVALAYAKRAKWLTVVAACARSGAPSARELCQEWSKLCKEKYDESDFYRAYASFAKDTRENGTGTGTLIEIARKGGWRIPPWHKANAAGQGQAEERWQAGNEGEGRQEFTQDEPTQEGWAKPTPISSELLPVPPWEPRFLPAPLADMVEDYAGSVPMNQEFVASNVTAACGSLISDKAQLSMKQRSPWYETPNVWVLNIAPPSARKTPGLQLCEDALKRVEEVFEQEYRTALATHQSEKIAYEAAMQGIKLAAKKGAPPTPVPLEPEPPVQQRAVTNDSTYEALSVIAKGGPVVVLNDEASGLFAQMADPKNQTAKAFYLAAHNGSKSYKSDRIGRGTTSIPRLCLSLVCNIQPEPLMRLTLGAAREGRQADGFMQRFGLMTMPDPVQHTELVDNTYDLFKYIAGIDALVGLVDYDPVAHGAQQSILGEALPCFSLSDDAMALWKAEYARLRAEELNPELLEAYRQHVGKEPKVIATVALVIHAVEGHHGDISGPVMERAIAASQFYLSHAKRVYYMAAHDIYAEPARLIAARMARGEITGEFTSREAKRWGWTGCKDTDSTEAIMELLEDTNWTRLVAAGSSTRGGRATKRWRVNPLAKDINS